MKFEYERKNITLEAYGKEYPIPTKTAALVDGINAVNKRINDSKTAAETTAATRAGIALYIGEAEAERIFPEDKLSEIDTDEIGAFWWTLLNASAEATKAVIEKYAPNKSIRTARAGK